MVLAEDGRGVGAGIPRRVYWGDRDGGVVFRVYFAYPIGWIGVIGSVIP